jgi:hypothetical protein
MLTVPGVDSCTVFENPTGGTDSGTGLPPYSVEVLVHSATAPHYTAQDVVDQIFASKPVGTKTYGGLSGTATDSSGNTHTIYYSEPVTVRTYIFVGIVLTPDNAYPGSDAVKDAIVSYVTLNKEVGDDLYESDIINIVADFAGVRQVDYATVDNVYPPVSPSLFVTPRQLVTVQASDITILT